MMRIFKSITGGECPRHIATIRHGRAKRTLSAVRRRTTASARHRAAVAERDNPMQEQSFSIAPLLAMAEARTFSVKWPSAEDVLTIGLALDRDGALDGPVQTARVWAIMLERLCGLAPATARRIALAHSEAVAAMFRHAFCEMRSQLPAGDPRLNERLPAVLAGGA